MASPSLHPTTHPASPASQHAGHGHRTLWSAMDGRSSGAEMSGQENGARRVLLQGRREPARGAGRPAGDASGGSGRGQEVAGRCCLPRSPTAGPIRGYRARAAAAASISHSVTAFPFPLPPCSVHGAFKLTLSHTDTHARDAITNSITFRSHSSSGGVVAGTLAPAAFKLETSGSVVRSRLVDAAAGRACWVRGRAHCACLLMRW